MRILTLLKNVICSGLIFVSALLPIESKTYVSHPEFRGVKAINGKVSFTLALKQRNTDILFDALESVSNPLSKEYGNYWSRNDIYDLVVPDIIDVYPVLGWLSDNNVKFKFFGDAAKCSCHISDLERLFQVKFKEIYPDIFQLLTSQYTIPFNIIEFIEGLGIHEIPRRHKFNRILNNGDFVGREVVSRLYHIPDIKATSVSAAAFEYGGLSNGFSQSDLLMQQSLNGLSKKRISKKHIIGYYNESIDIESSLDVQMISQTAPGIDEWYWNENHWLYSQAVNFFNSTNIPQIGSISYGWSEMDQCSILDDCIHNETSKMYVDRVNIEYAKVGLRGVTLVVSSGDAGSPSRSNELCDDNTPHIIPEFPASSPFVLAIGGTYLSKNASHYSTPPNFTTPLCKKYGCTSSTQEKVSNFVDIEWTSGGSFSNYSSRPKWQQSAVDTYLHSGVKLPNKYFNINGRGVPDITAVSHNAPVMYNQNIMAIDGTSMSAPIIAGILALINQHQLNNGRPVLGFVNPLLYQAYKDDPHIFNDYTTGNTHATETMLCSDEFGFVASKGWDPVFGLGSLQVDKLLSYLDDHVKIRKTKMSNDKI